MILLFVSLATAATGEVSLGGDLLPDSFGSSRARGSLGLAMGEAYGPWQIGVSGTVRGAWEVQPVGALERLELAGGFGGLRLGAGRLVKLDLRGPERLDGVLVGGDGGVWSGSAWAGRLWFPEELGAVDATYVAGAEGRVRVPTAVLGSRLSAGLGAELRDTTGALDARLHAGAQARGVMGGGLSGVAEVSPGDGRWRAQARVDAPVAKVVDLGASWRWEDLPPATIPDAAEPPATWLSDGAYGVATGLARVRDGVGSLVVEAGPVIGAGESLGALGRLDAACDVGAVTPRVFGRGAWTGENGYLGGGLGVDAGGDALGAGLDGGLYRVRHLDDRDSWVGEARAHGRAALPAGGASGLALEVELAAGTDRLLSPWARAGLLLTGRMDAGRHARAGEGS